MTTIAMWRLWEYATVIQSEPGLPDHVRQELLHGVKIAGRIMLQNIQPTHLEAGKAILGELEKLKP